MLALSPATITADTYKTTCSAFVVRCPQHLPAGIINTNIGHRFYGPISEGLETLYGLDSGANVILYTAYSISKFDSIHFQRIKQDKEYQFGYQRSLQILKSPWFATIQLSGLWFQDNAINVFNGLSVIGLSYHFHNAQLNTNFITDFYNQKSGFGSAINYMILDDLDLVVEGYSTTQSNDSALSLGMVYHTFGHRFKFGIHNSTALSLRHLINGTSTKDWGLGFQIHRLLELD